MSFTDFDGTLASLPDYCAVSAGTQINADGTINPVTKFSPCVVILRFPRGLKLLEGTQSEVATIKLNSTSDTKMGIRMYTLPFQLGAHANSVSFGYYYSLNAKLTNCTLEEDVYAVWFNFYDWGAHQLVVNVRDVGGNDHVYTLREFNYKPGNVYEISSDTLYESNGGDPLPYSE